MNKPVFPSYQDLLNEEAVSVPEALRLDTQPEVANQVIATDVWTDRSIFEQEVEHMWPRVWQMVCRETALQKPGDYFVYDIADRTFDSHKFIVCFWYRAGQSPSYTTVGKGTCQQSFQYICFRHVYFIYDHCVDALHRLFEFGRMFVFTFLF